MKEREKVPMFTLIWVLITLIIALSIVALGPSIYEGMKDDNEVKHGKQTKKVEAYKRKPTKRLYKDAFKERKQSEDANQRLIQFNKER